MFSFFIYYQSFTDQDAYIVTHYPKPGDAVDFLRLITDHESEVVVCMEPLKKEKLVRILHQA